VITLDALHTTRKTARLITDTCDAHYMLVLKGNQCATRRSVVFPLQVGEIRREISGSDGLPDTERYAGTIACQETGGQVQASEMTRRDDPRDMAKALLPEPQSSADAIYIHRKDA